MTISVRAYKPEDADAWDAFCSEALQATLLHSRKFLSYHRERFIDQSLMIENEGALVGLFPAARSPEASDCIVSHPGSTFGGVLHQGGLRGSKMISALERIVSHYSEQGYCRLLYKVVPAFYHRAPACDDVYALFRLGAKKVRCDLSCTIDLARRLPVSQRRRRALKKGQNASVSVMEGRQHLPALWPIIEETLGRRHGVRPVHSLEEITLLAVRFPEDIRCICASLDERLVAGVLIFRTPVTHHAQYIASAADGNAVNALDTVFEYCITAAIDSGASWFDFGISTLDHGRFLNDGLYAFKSEFGSGGTVHDFYELEMNS